MLLFLAAFGAYAVWCARPFYMRPKIVFESAIPQDVEAMARRELGGTSGFGPESFSFERYWELLRQPFNGPDPVIVNSLGGDNFLMATHPAHPFTAIEIWRTEDGWDKPQVSKEIPRLPSHRRSSPPLTPEEWERVQRTSPLPDVYSTD